MIVTLLPGAHPFDELEIALRRLCRCPRPPARRPAPRCARPAARGAPVLPDDQRDLLLVIDQFEEVFTLVETRREARVSWTACTPPSPTPRSPVRVIVTLRADFYDRPLMIPDFCELVRQRTEVVTP